MKSCYSRILVATILIVGIFASAVLYRAIATGKTADYDMDEFLAARPLDAVAPEPVEPRLGSVAEMLEGLRQRLLTESDDADGWVLLAKSYYFLNRQAEAREALDKALAAGYAGAWKPLPRIESTLQLPDPRIFPQTRSAWETTRRGLRSKQLTR